MPGVHLPRLDVGAPPARHGQGGLGRVERLAIVSGGPD